jgi:hypothetical protein
MHSQVQNGEGVVTKFACSRMMCITRMNKAHTWICKCGLIAQESFAIQRGLQGLTPDQNPREYSAGRSASKKRKDRSEHMYPT